MNEWEKLGRIWTPDGSSLWAKHGFMTPVPVAMGGGRIRLFAGIRDDDGVSRIGWIDVLESNPLNVIATSDTPALDIGAPGMFDDNGCILGDVIRLLDGTLRMYYVGFQIPAKTKFMAFTGVAESTDGTAFKRVYPTPILDRAPNAQFINALHSIAHEGDKYRAWISCGQGWEEIDGRDYPQYDCWSLDSEDGLYFDMRKARRIVKPSKTEYRIGRPRANKTASGYELRVTSDTFDKQYASYRFISSDGVEWERSTDIELPRGELGEWDHEMTCYPAIYCGAEVDYLFYNGNGMGQTGVGAAMRARTT